MLNRHIFAFLLATAAVALAGTGAKAGTDGFLIRHSADFFKFDGSEFFTSATPAAGGAVFYTKTVVPPPGSNVIYITVFATGNTHSFSSGNSQLWSCTLNGVFCQPGRPFAGAPGWVNLQTPGADEHDNSISYSWCAKLPKPRAAGTPFTTTLFLASANGTDDVFVEGGYVYIDSSFIAETDKCVLSPFAASSADLELKALAAKGVRIAGTNTTKHHK